MIPVIIFLVIVALITPAAILTGRYNRTREREQWAREWEEKE